MFIPRDSRWTRWIDFTFSKSTWNKKEQETNRCFVWCSSLPGIPSARIGNIWSGSVDARSSVLRCVAAVFVVPNKAEEKSISRLCQTNRLLDPGRQWEDQYFVPIFVGLLPFPIFPSCFVQDASADISEVVYFGAVCSFFRPSELNFISAKHHIKCWKRNLFCFEWESQWLHCNLAFWWHFPNGCASEHGYVYFLSHQSRIPPAGKSVLLVQFVLNNVNSIQSKGTCASLQGTVRQRGLFMCVCLYHTAKCHRIGCTDMLVCVPQKDTFCWYLVWRGMSPETGEVQHLNAASGGEKRACEHGKQLLQNLHPSKCRLSWVCSF